MKAISKDIQRPYVTSKSNCWKNSVIDYEISVGGEILAKYCLKNDPSKFITASKEINGLFTNNFIVVSNIRTGSMQKKIIVKLPSDDRIRHVALSKDSKRIIYCSFKFFVYVYDFNSENCVHELKWYSPIQNVCVSETGTTVVIVFPEEVTVWDLKKYNRPHTSRKFVHK